MFHRPLKTATNNQSRQINTKYQKDNKIFKTFAIHFSFSKDQVTGEQSRRKASKYIPSNKFVAALNRCTRYIIPGLLHNPAAGRSQIIAPWSFFFWH